MEGEMFLLLGIMLAGVGFIGAVILAIPAWIIYVIVKEPDKAERDLGNRRLAVCVVVAAILLFIGNAFYQANTSSILPENTIQDTELHNAAWNGDTARVERLIRDGADINAVFDSRECTVLLAATYTNHTATVEALLRHNPTNLNTPNQEGDTALQEAKAHHNAEMVRLLKEAGAIDESEVTEETESTDETETTK